MRHVFRRRLYVCACGNTFAGWHWETDPLPVCGPCNKSMDEQGDPALGESASVIGDDIPGGLLVRHAICNPDGTPRRYYSKSAIREAAREAGWTIDGETPKAAKHREV